MGALIPIYNHPSHIYLVSLAYHGKHGVKSYYDMTQPPSISYESGCCNEFYIQVIAPKSSTWKGSPENKNKNG